MKKLYSTLSTVSLLFSLPLITGLLTEKLIQNSFESGETKESTEKVRVETDSKPEASSPLCRGGGEGGGA